MSKSQAADVCSVVRGRSVRPKWPDCCSLDLLIWGAAEEEAGPRSTIDLLRLSSPGPRGHERGCPRSTYVVGLPSFLEVPSLSLVEISAFGQVGRRCYSYIQWRALPTIITLGLLCCGRAHAHVLVCSAHAQRQDGKEDLFCVKNGTFHTHFHGSGNWALGRNALLSIGYSLWMVRLLQWTRHHFHWSVYCSSSAPFKGGEKASVKNDTLLEHSLGTRLQSKRAMEINHHRANYC